MQGAEIPAIKMLALELTRSTIAAVAPI